MKALRDTFRAAWSEHGAWAVGLTSCAAGIGMARSLEPAVLLLLPCVALLVGAKGLVARFRRTGRGLAPALLFALLGGACAMPAALAAPLVIGAAACVVGPFSVLYVVYADSPRWTRSFAVEVAGSSLLAAGAAVPVLVARPPALLEAFQAGLFFVLVFLPGVLRARIPKEPTAALRWAATLIAVGAAAMAALFPLLGRTGLWALLAVPPLLKDAYRAWSLPAWTTRTLGLNLTLKGIFVAAVVAATWRPT